MRRTLSVLDGCAVFLLDAASTGYMNSPPIKFWLLERDGELDMTRREEWKSVYIRSCECSAVQQSAIMSSDSYHFQVFTFPVSQSLAYGSIILISWKDKAHNQTS